ncbi:MAG: DNA polymerase III subunit beta [bacterium]|nr:DNA polymerase III subunit beta [bacterium]
MKFTCLQEHINKGLSLTSHLASKNVSLPILNTVLIHGEKNTITFTATNLEIGMRTVIRGKLEAEGSIAVPAKTLADYVGLLTEEKLEVLAEGTTLSVKGKNTKTTIKGQSAEEFPIIPEVAKNQPILLKTKDLKTALGQTAYAVAQDESRPEISGVYMRINGSTATVVATDSYRLAEKKIQLLKPVSEELQIIIPTRTIQELTRVISDDVQQVEMHVSDNQILFVSENVELVSRLIEGQYPEYHQIIPQEYVSEATVNREELLKAVKGAALFSKSGVNDVHISLDVEKKQVKISSANTQLGEHETELAAGATGASTEIVFNHRYLLDGLNSIENNEVKLLLIDGGNPGTIKPKNDDGFLYIIMPIKQ